MLFGIYMQHSYREANQVADSLTMYDLSQSISLKMLNLVPKFMPLPILRDSICTSFPRCFLFILFFSIFLDASCLHLF